MTKAKPAPTGAKPAIPATWRGCKSEGIEDNTALIDETFYFRERTSSGIRYFRRGDYGADHEEYLPEWVPTTWDTPPETIEGLFRQLDEYARPIADRAYEQGRQKGRQEIRAIVRDLVGPETARNLQD